MRSVPRWLALLAIVLVPFSGAFAVRVVIVYGGEMDQEIRPHWLTGVAEAHEFLGSFYVDDNQDRYFYFQGSAPDRKAAKLSDNKGVKAATTTAKMVEEITAHANADDVILIVFGHGTIGTGTVDMLSAVSTDKLAALDLYDVVKAKNDRHRLLVIHVACHAGLTWNPAAVMQMNGYEKLTGKVTSVELTKRSSDIAAELVAKHVSVAAFAEETPADGEIALQMVTWILQNCVAGESGCPVASFLAEGAKHYGHYNENVLTDRDKQLYKRGRRCAVYPPTLTSIPNLFTEWTPPVKSVKEDVKKGPAPEHSAAYQLQVESRAKEATKDLLVLSVHSGGEVIASWKALPAKSLFVAISPTSEHVIFASGMTLKEMEKGRLGLLFDKALDPEVVAGMKVLLQVHH